MTTASIVTHRNLPRQLEKVLSCALASSIDVVYVIDNSPDDSLRKYAEHPRVRYRHVENRGFGAGHNIAVREALADFTDYHLIINPDVWWEGDVVAPMVDFMERKENGDVGMLMPKLFYPDGTLQYSCRMLPTPWDLFAKRFLPPFLTARRMRRYLLAEADHDAVFNCPYLLGSFLLFRGDALRSEGLFDERFFMYPEDIDITRRMHRHWQTLYWPGVAVIHEHQAASRRSLKMLRIHLRNMIKYFDKWGWFFDGERRRFNRRLLDSMPRHGGAEAPGRG